MYNIIIKFDLVLSFVLLYNFIISLNVASDILPFFLSVVLSYTWLLICGFILLFHTFYLHIVWSSEPKQLNELGNYFILLCVFFVFIIISYNVRFIVYMIARILFAAFACGWLFVYIGKIRQTGVRMPWNLWCRPQGTSSLRSV